MTDDNNAKVYAVAWFEFLLDDSLLEKHLSQPNPDPSASELISLFLYQADVASGIAREINGKENGVAGNGNVSSLDKGTNENKKITALRLLAIKTACFLRWDLTVLEKKLPISILRNLLLELLKVVSVDNVSDPVTLMDMRPEAVFAVLLYHRWVVTTLVKNSFPSKPSKVANVQVPGLLDPSISSAAMKETVLKVLHDNAETSISILDAFMAAADKTTRMLTLSSVALCNDDDNDDDGSSSIVCNWRNSVSVNPIEISCQIAYELGCIQFYRQNYANAESAFTACRVYKSQLSSESSFVNVDESCLNGYLSGCRCILGQTQLAHSPAAAPSLYQRVVDSVRNNFQDLTPLLVEDIKVQELSWTFRSTLEESTMLYKRSDSLHAEVVICNLLRRAIDGRTVIVDVVKMLNRTIGLVDFFLQVCLDIHQSLSQQQIDNLKIFLRSLCCLLAPCTQFSQKLLATRLAELFSVSERDELKTGSDSGVKSAPLDMSFSLPAPVDDVVKVAEIERQLLLTTSPATIKDLVPKLASKIGNNQTVYLSDKWYLPHDIQQAIAALPIPQPALAMTTHVLVAKARVCLQLKQYNVARELIFTADTGVRDISFKLSKLLNWELLKTDVLQCIDDGVFGADAASDTDLATRCRKCIATFRRDILDVLPSQELLACCIAFLLNAKDWDFVSSLKSPTTSGSGVLHFGHLIAVLCNEVPQLKAARSSASDFLEAVSLTFADNTQTKRGNSGVPTSLMQRDATKVILPVEPLKAFISKIKEPVVLSLFVSCMTKLFNHVCIDITEDIFSDYTTLWPASVSLPLSLSSVTEMVSWLMSHVLTVNPQHPSWLRTQGDIDFAQGSHWASLRRYLELGIVTTEFFTEPITKNVYNDQVYRRMIRCCSQLNSHTQAAVLCQFLDDVDYTMAFKALQERSVHDAADAYYDCIWDTTLLEYLINLHTKRGELEKRQYAIQLIGQPELNSSNREDILSESARVRKSLFLRRMAFQYLGVHCLPRSCDSVVTSSQQTTNN